MNLFSPKSTPFMIKLLCHFYQTSLWSVNWGGIFRSFPLFHQHVTDRNKIQFSLMFPPDLSSPELEGEMRFFWNNFDSLIFLLKSLGFKNKVWTFSKGNNNVAIFVLRYFYHKSFAEDCLLKKQILTAKKHF